MVITVLTPMRLWGSTKNNKGQIKPNPECVPVERVRRVRVVYAMRTVPDEDLVFEAAGE